MKCFLSSRGRSISHVLRSSSSSFTVAQSTLAGQLRWFTSFHLLYSASFSKGEFFVHSSRNAQWISTPKDDWQEKQETVGSYGGLHAAPLSLPPRVVIYDGVCHLCNAGVNWVIRVDKYGKIKFCALQSQAAEPYLFICGLTREDVLQQFVFVEGPGLIHRASTAAIKVASYLPPPYSALSSFLLIPGPVRDAIYDVVAARRYKWFGRSTGCILPSKDVLDRFIDREELLEEWSRQNHEEEESKD
ncbi:hypothetical protein O6H91_16G021000 [Diphasiastrum complanatum]|uniref:Uncharacterized protein n=1 Tax=Diphasiastrum complanatum TaxID=34168 RepID=A0ACC2BAE7_DIPCM|nr:hypothetical protein O6H91_16G021000 [Diphasiastrum complanatum]